MLSKTTALLLIVAAAAAVIVSGSEAGDPVTLPKGPWVTIVGDAPLAVSGTRFTPGARVVVRLTRPSGTLSRAVRVGAQGRFLVRFLSVRLPACSTPNVTVLWRLGIVKAHGPQRDCMAP
jgi:hypothetical protein